MTGWEREKRGVFDEVADSYDKVRSDYPDELFSDVSAYCGRVGRALEIGAGTGKATAHILGMGYDVTAVELGKNLSRALEERFGNNPSFAVVNSSFEDAALDADVYDLVYAATAFHWVDASVGCPKVREILRDGGTFALLRYHMAGTGETVFEAVQEVYEKHYYSFYPEKHRPVKRDRAFYASPDGLYEGFRIKSMADYGFTDTAMRFYERDIDYTTEQYLSLLDTFSDHRSLPDENRRMLYDGIREVIDAHGGINRIHFLYQLYMGKKL